jgi:hypothetical protein
LLDILASGRHLSADPRQKTSLKHGGKEVAEGLKEDLKRLRGFVCITGIEF